MYVATDQAVVDHFLVVALLVFVPAKIVDVDQIVDAQEVQHVLNR